MSIELRSFQPKAVEGLRSNIRGGMLRQILSAPTGSGKTVIGAYLIDECRRKGKRAVFVCDRIPLIEQTSRTFDKYDIPHGVIQADHWRRRPWERIQIASAQTLARRQWPADLDLIIVDEAHTIQTSTVKRIALGDCVAIGLTATPFTKGLGLHYQGIVSVTTTNQLIAEKMLAPYRVFAASEPDMSGAKVVRGEWSDDEAAERAMPIVGDCVAEYLKHGDGKKFIAFGVNVAHCEELQRQFLAAGVQCALYTYRTGDEERAKMLEEYRRPGTYLRGLISVSALAKGFDVEDVEVIIMARPLRRSLAEHLQILGRGLRMDPNNPGKVCTILDHAGNMLRFWWQMRDFFQNGATQLHDGSRPEKKEREPKEREPAKCPKCAFLHAPRPTCPNCGHEYPRRSNVLQVDGKLVELTGSPVGVTAEVVKQALFSQLLGVAEMRGHAVGWARHRYREKTGENSDALQLISAEPTAAVLNWVRSRAIAFARGKR